MIQLADKDLFEGGEGIGKPGRGAPGLVGNPGELVKVHADAPEFIEGGRLQGAALLHGKLAAKGFDAGIFGR